MKKVVLFLVYFLMMPISFHAMMMQPMPMLMKPSMKMMKILQIQKNECDWRHDIKAKELVYLKKLREQGCDLNEANDLGRFPLENVWRIPSIAELLDFGADPKKCTHSLLVKPILYHGKRIDNQLQLKSLLFPNREDLRKKYTQDIQKRERRMFGCFKYLLDHGANPDADEYGVLPLHSIVKVLRDGCLIDGRPLLRLLILYGANPDKIEPSSGRNAYHYANTAIADFISNKRRKYQAEYTIMSETENGDSYFYWLPSDVVKVIVKYVRRGRYESPKISEVIPRTQQVPCIVYEEASNESCPHQDNTKSGVDTCVQRGIGGDKFSVAEPVAPDAAVPIVSSPKHQSKNIWSLKRLWPIPFLLSGAGVMAAAGLVITATYLVLDDMLMHQRNSKKRKHGSLNLKKKLLLSS